MATSRGSAFQVVKVQSNWREGVLLVCLRHPVSFWHFSSWQLLLVTERRSQNRYLLLKVLWAAGRWTSAHSIILTFEIWTSSLSLDIMTKTCPCCFVLQTSEKFRKNKVENPLVANRHVLEMFWNLEYFNGLYTALSVLGRTPGTVRTTEWRTRLETCGTPTSGWGPSRKSYLSPHYVYSPHIMYKPIPIHPKYFF